MGELTKYRTDLLFSTPSFLTGMGSVMNIGGNYYLFNSSKTGADADRRAIQNDWEVVGEDIFFALRKISEEYSQLAERN